MMLGMWACGATKQMESTPEAAIQTPAGFRQFQIVASLAHCPLLPLPQGGSDSRLAVYGTSSPRQAEDQVSRD